MSNTNLDSGSENHQAVIMIILLLGAGSAGCVVVIMRRQEWTTYWNCFNVPLNQRDENDHIKTSLMNNPGNKIDYTEIFSRSPNDK